MSNKSICHKCAGNSLTHASFCQLFDKAEAQSEVDKCRATTTEGENMTEFTQWFPATTKPVHEGYYDTRTKYVGEMVLYWDGREWRASASTPKRRISLFLAREWRGLATSPVVAA